MNQADRRLPDLNLVRVFLTIWETRSLTLAGQRLGLTQPAVSHALRRLREAFADPLFVRVSGGMLPTELAARLHGPFDDAVRLIHAAVQDGERFDPLTAQRVFRVAMSDVSEFFFLPALMRWLAGAAPGVHLRVVPLEPAGVAQAMRAGEVDLTIGFVPELDEEPDHAIASDHLLTDGFVCLVRAGHPAARRRARLDLGSLGYVQAATTATGHRLAERWMTETGVRRRIALRLGHFTVAPSVVLATDLAVIFPESIARLINRDGAFALLPLPPGQPAIDVRLHTHAHFRADPGIRWLRDSLVGLFGDGRHPGTG